MYFVIINDTNNREEYTQFLKENEDCDVLDLDLLKLEEPELDDAREYADNSLEGEFQNRIDTALDHWKSILPVKDSENNDDIILYLLHSNWHVFEEGTLVISRKTHSADVHFILADAVFDKSQQDMIEIDPDYETFDIDDDNADIYTIIKQIVDSTLIAANFAGFGLMAVNPAIGLVVAGGASVLQYLFDQYFPKSSKIDEQSQLGNLIQTLFETHDIKVQLAEINSYIDWIDTTKDNEESHDDEYLDDFKNKVHNSFAPENNLMVGMELLEDNDYKYMGVSTYILGASLVCLLFKMAILLDSEERAVWESGYLSEGINYLIKRYNHAHDTMKSAQKATKDRLSKITPTQGPETGSDVTPYGPVNYQYYYFMDGDKKHTYRCYEACCIKWGGKQACDKAYNQLVASTKKSLQNQYFYYGDDDQTTKDMWKSINDLKSNIDKFQEWKDAKPKE